MKQSILVVTLLIFFSALSLYAQEQPYELRATVTIETVFSLQVEPTGINFGLIQPGKISEPEDIMITCTTNGGIDWKIVMQSSLPLTFETYSVPNDRFKWTAKKIYGMGTLKEQGIMNSDAPIDLYIAHPDESVTESPIKFNVAFIVDVPLSQVGGDYESVIYIRMMVQ